MDKGTKRKRESGIPTLVFSAAGHNRFAKLLTEESLEQIKEIVRKRLKLSSVSDFTLFYDTDIALENDDDFDAFAAHAESSLSAINVLVKIEAHSHTSPAPDGGSLSLGSQSSKPVVLDVDSRGTSPPRKKRKTVDTPDANLHSSALGLEKQKAKVAPIDVETGPAIPAGASNEVLEDSRSDERRKKKKAKKVVQVSSSGAPAPSVVSISGPSDTPTPVTDATATQERRKKKLKTTEKGSDNAPTLPAIPSSVISTNVPTDKSKIGKGSDNAPTLPALQSSVISTNVSTDTSGANPVAEPVAIVAERRKKKSKVTSQDGAAAETKLLNSLAPEGDKPKAKTKQKSLDHSASKTPASKKASKKSKTDTQGEDGPTGSKSPKNPEKSVNLPFPAQLANTITSVGAPQGTAGAASFQNQDLPLNVKAKLPSDGQKKAQEGTEDVVSQLLDPSPEARSSDPVKEFLKDLVRKMPAASARTTDNVNEQTVEGNNNSSTDATKVALTVTKGRQKNNCFKDSENVNPPSPVLRAHAEKGGLLVDVPGHKLTRSGAGFDEDSSSEESDIAPTTRKIITPLPIGSYADSELDAIIRGPVASRLTMDDVLEDDEEELAESVVLEQDNEEQVDFRRQSRRLNAAAAPSSGEEDEDDDDNNISDATSVNEKAQPAMVVSVSGPRRLSMRSVTEPLQAIDACQTMDIDHVGDIAVDEAMASDRAMFGIVAPTNDGVDIIDGVVDPDQAELSTPIPLAPTPAKKPWSKVTSTDAERQRTPAGEEDPIQPAEDFPPTPAQPNKGNPSAIVRMKNGAGKTSVKLSQLDPPFLSPQLQSQTVETDGEKPADRQAVDAPRKTRSSSRLAAVTAAPLSPKRRGPDKIREQRAQEKATKLAAKEERERLKREKALAKTGGKKNLKGASKYSSPQANIVEVAPPSREPSVELPRAAPLHSRTPMSQDEWTVLSPNAPDEEDYKDQSVHDELQSSSPATEATVAPLFFPSQSQVQIPYSQRKEEGFGPDSQKDAENDDSEEEIVALMKPSNRRANVSSVSFRRLTDIASQPSMFSTPSLRAAEFPSSTFPRAKVKRNELYGTQDDDSSDTDSDSSAGEVPSHIPKSRRAGRK